jgi:hypothetical protein
MHVQYMYIVYVCSHMHIADYHRILHVYLDCPMYVYGSLHTHVHVHVHSRSHIYMYILLVVMKIICAGPSLRESQKMLHAHGIDYHPSHASAAWGWYPRLQRHASQSQLLLSMIA